MAVHAILSPSGAAAWMICPGKPAMEENFPDDSSEFADEGTAAHHVAALCLKRKQMALEHLGLKVYVLNGDPVSLTAANAAKKSDIVREFEVDDDMVGHIQTYLDIVRDCAGTDGQLLVEQSLPIHRITGEAGAKGTGDAVILRDDELTVIDLKFGRGVEVSAIKNKQLMTYALAAFDELNGLLGDFKKFRVVISQPRIHAAPSEWTFDLAELEAFRTEIMARATTARTAYEFRTNWVKFDSKGKFIGEDGYLSAAPEACKFCRAKAVCPAIAAAVEAEIGSDFQTVAEAAADDMSAEKASSVGVITDPAQTSSEVLSLKMKSIELIEEFCRSVRAEVERRLFHNIPVPGFKLVQGKRGARKWDDPSEVEIILKGMRLKIEEMYTLKLLSPTGAEKLLKKDSPVRWKRLQNNIEQPEGKASVAPEHDTRPPLAVAATSKDFADETGEDVAQ